MHRKEGTKERPGKVGNPLQEKRLASERTSGSFAVFMSPSSDYEEELQYFLKGFVDVMWGQTFSCTDSREPSCACWGTCSPIIPTLSSSLSLWLSS